MIIFQLKDNSPPKEVPQIWYTVRKKVGDMRYTLPQGVQGPFFNDEFGDVYGVIYALEADGFSYAEAKEFADDVRQRLLRVPDVAKVELFGVQDEKLFIEISQKRLAQLGLDMNQVLGQLGQHRVECGLQFEERLGQLAVGGNIAPELRRCAQAGRRCSTSPATNVRGPDAVSTTSPPSASTSTALPATSPAGRCTVTSRPSVPHSSR